MYIQVKTKFFITLVLTVLWITLCFWLSLPWMRSLAVYITIIPAAIIVISIALIPGFMYMFLLIGFLFDKRRDPPELSAFPAVTLLVPAYNEEKGIAATIHSILTQDYSGIIEVIVIDDGSNDQTPSILKELAEKHQSLVVLKGKHEGKASALNLGLSKASHDLIISIDADTYLVVTAVREIVKQFKRDPANTAAVAGSVYVRNSRESFMGRIQEWDYFNAIAAIKRLQSLFQGTLVAQGAFSIYQKKCLLEVGGWPICVGEDIVLTWSLLMRGYRIGFSERAISFTNVPTTYKQFFHQRSRWARGMLEGFRHHPSILLLPRISTFFIYWNLLFPFLDAVFFFIFIPGLVAALFGHFYIAGPMTLAVLPLVVISNLAFIFTQRKVFQKKHFKIRRNILGFFYYILIYQFLVVPAVLHGYASEMFNLKKTWGTK